MEIGDVILIAILLAFFNFVDQGTRTLFLTLQQGSRVAFLLLDLSDESPVSVVSKRELFTVKGPVSDAAYHVKSQTAHWIGERNTKMIFKKKIDGPDNYVRHLRVGGKSTLSADEGTLEVAIDNRNNYNFFLNHHHIVIGDFFRRYRKLPLKFPMSPPGYGHMALDTQSRRVFYTIQLFNRKVQLMFMSYGKRQGQALLYETRQDIKAFVLDPAGPYAYACIWKLSRINLRKHEMDNVLNSPPGTYCPVMAAYKQQIFVMVNQARKLSVAVTSMRTGSVVSMIGLSVQNTLTGLEVLEM